MKHVAVIGGGISGLTAAYRLRQAGVRVTLFESSDHLGGVIRTVRSGDCLLETGPDCWASNKPAAFELADELGIADQIHGTREGVRRSFILHRGALKRLPQGFFLISPMSLRALMATPILSFTGKLRMGIELFKPRRKGDGDESLAGFVRRRFGNEALERIAQPMVAGIYTADPEKLSLRATFPAFLKMEREHGSIIKALRKRSKREEDGDMAKASGPRYGLFVTFRDGMSTLPGALVAALPGDSICKNTPVRGVNRHGNVWQVELADETLDFDGVVVALPASKAGTLLASADGELSRALGEIEYAGAGVVNFIFNRKQIGHSMDGMGAVIPSVENRRIIAFSFSSVKFEGRAPEGKAIVRVFMGGALNPDLAGLAPETQTQIALEEIRDLLEVNGEPEFSLPASHAGSMAQYHVGHLERVVRIRELETQHPTLALAGNGFDGVGIPDCIRNANNAAARLLTSFSGFD